MQSKLFVSAPFSYMTGLWELRKLPGINEDRQRGNIIVVNGRRVTHPGAFAAATHSLPEQSVELTPEIDAQFQQIAAYSLASLITEAPSNDTQTKAQRALDAMNKLAWRRQTAGDGAGAAALWEATSILAREFKLEQSNVPGSEPR